MELVIRSLERTSVTIIPDTIALERETLLTQYIIKSWELDFRNASK